MTAEACRAKAEELERSAESSSVIDHAGALRAQAAYLREHADRLETLACDF